MVGDRFQGEVHAAIRDALEGRLADPAHAPHLAREMVPVVYELAERLRGAEDREDDPEGAARAMADVARTVLLETGGAGYGLEALAEDVDHISLVAWTTVEELPGADSQRVLDAATDPAGFAMLPPLISQPGVGAQATVSYLGPLSSLAEATSLLLVPDDSFTARYVRLVALALVQSAMADRLSGGRTSAMRLARVWGDAGRIADGFAVDEAAGLDLWVVRDVEADELVDLSGVALRHILLGSPLEADVVAEFVWAVVHERGEGSSRVAPGFWPKFVERWNLNHPGDVLTENASAVRWHRHRPRESPA